METILELKNINKEFKQPDGKLVVLKKINIKLFKSQCIGLIGPSGSGKSTLLHIAGLLDKETSGQIYIKKKKCHNLSEENKNLISHGKLKLDPSQLECEWDGKSLPDKLTTTEFLIVKELAKRPGVIKERSQLMDIAYKENTDIEDRTIDSHVKRIRKKFKKIDSNFSAIETRYGSGYRWNVS